MSAAVTLQNPFPGLRPFRPEDATLFFGRDEQTGEALERLLRQRLLAVVGVSGCGKSSLVAAGMIPALEMGMAGDPAQRWRVATMRPGDGPLRELARCLDLPLETLAQRTYGLLEAVEKNLPAGWNLLLVVDQFEEIFAFRDRVSQEGQTKESQTKERTPREGAASEADLTRYHLETVRQRALLATGIAGTRQTVEQAVDNEKRAEATLALNFAQLDQQRQQVNVLDELRNAIVIRHLFDAMDNFEEARDVSHAGIRRG